MMRHSGRFLLAVMLACVIIVPAAQAAGPEADQKTAYTPPLKAGDSYRFPLYMVGTGGPVEAAGDMGSWLSFDKTSVAFGEWLLVTVTVPSGSDPGAKYARVRVAGTDVTVVVVDVVSKSLQDISVMIEALRGNFSAVSNNQDAMKTSIQDTINSMSIDLYEITNSVLTLQTAVSDIQEKQQNLSMVEKAFAVEKQALQKKADDMQARIDQMESKEQGLQQENKQLSDITGKASVITFNWSATTFIVGLIVGIAVVVLYLRGTLKLRRMMLESFRQPHSYAPKSHINPDASEQPVKNAYGPEHERVRSHVDYNYKSK